MFALTGMRCKPSSHPLTPPHLRLSTFIGKSIHQSLRSLGSRIKLIMQVFSVQFSGPTDDHLALFAKTIHPAGTLVQSRLRGIVRQPRKSKSWRQRGRANSGRWVISEYGLRTLDHVSNVCSESNLSGLFSFSTRSFVTAKINGSHVFSP